LRQSKILTDCAAGRAYSRAPRCASTYVLSLSLNKESTKESQPKAAAFGNCSLAALQRKRREIAYKLLMLCPKSCQHARQAKKARNFAGCQGALSPLVHFLGSFFLE